MHPLQKWECCEHTGKGGIYIPQNELVLLQVDQPCCQQERPRYQALLHQREG
jgi:hypothetical protein